MKRIFPKINAEKYTAYDQLEHFKSELLEVVERIDQGDFNGIVGEVLDVQHSAETFLTLAEERHGVQVDKVRKAVVKKNRARGYYAGT